MADGKIGSLTVEIGAKMDGLTDALNAVQQQLAGVNKSVQRSTTDLQKLGKTMTKAVTLPVLALGAAGIKAFSDFDDAMTQSTAIMGDLSADMRKQLEAVAKKLSGETTFSAAELGKAYYYLASAGLTAEQSMSALPQVAKFAQAGMFNLEQATELLSDSQTALGMRSSDASENLANMARVSDVLVDAANASNASVQQFAEALTNKAAGAFRLLNMSIEEGVAMLAAYADQGMKGAEAGEAVNMVLRDLQSAVNKNGQAWKDAGIAVYDSNGKMRNVSSIIRDLTNYLKPMTDQQKAAAISSLELQDRSVAYTKILLGTSDKIDGYTERLRNAKGVTEEIARKQLESFKSQLKLAANEALNAGAAIGAQLAPALAGAAKAVSAAVTKFMELDPLTKSVAGGIVGLTAALGPLSTIAGKAMNIMGAFSEATLKMKIISGLTVTAFAALVIEAGKLLGILNETRKAEEYAAEAAQRDTEKRIDLSNKLYELVKAGKMTATAFYEMEDRFKGNAAAMAMSIQKGNEGKALQEALADVTKKHSGEMDKQAEAAKKAEDAATGLAGGVSNVGTATSGASENLKKMKEELGLVFTDELKDKIKKIEDALKLYKGRLTSENEKKLTDDLAALKTELGLTDGTLQRLPTNIDRFKDVVDKAIGVTEEAAPATRSYADVLKDLGGEALGVKDRMKAVIEDQALVQNAFAMGMISVDTYENSMRLLEEALRSLSNNGGKEAAYLKDQWEVSFEDMAYIAQDVVRQISDIFTQLYDNKLTELENWYTKQKEYIEASYTNEEEKAKALEGLDKEYAAKQRKIKHDQAVAQKASAMAEALINAALGATKALSAAPPPFNIALAAITAGLTAVQIGLIAKQPIPMKKGGVILDKPTVSRDGRFLAGEAGPEAIIPLGRIGEVFAPLIDPIGESIAAAVASAGAMAPFSAAALGAPAYAPAMPPAIWGGAGRSTRPEESRVTVAPPSVQVYIGNEQLKEFVTKTVARENDLNRLGIKRTF